MPIPLTVGTRWDGDLLTLSLIGRLGVAEIPEVRRALFSCLADCPTAVLVDLHGLTVDSELPLTAFSSAAHQAGRWPGVPLLLYGLAERHLRSYPSREAALATLEPSAASPAVLRVDLAFRPGILGQVRELVADACGRWGLDRLSDEAALVVSELTGNALRHAQPPLRLVAHRCPLYLHLVVSDGSIELPELPAVPIRGGLRIRGRGLHLIDALVAGWGSLPTARGKAVWARLSTDPVGLRPAVGAAVAGGSYRVRTIRGAGPGGLRYG